MDLELRLSGDVPRRAYLPASGGPRFYAWCVGGEVRAAGRRSAINRAWAAYQRDRTSYPAGLVLCQRLGVTLEDLARVLIALESNDPWAALRAARTAAMDDVFERLGADPAAARTVFRLPSSKDLAETKLSHEQRAAVLAAADVIARRWSAQLAACAEGWDLLRRIAKAMRHGAPLLPRDLVIGPPGAGDLGRPLDQRFSRSVLLVPAGADGLEPPFLVKPSTADLSDGTLRRARAAALDGVALARNLAGTHLIRVRTGTRWALPSDVFDGLPPHHRASLRELRL